MSADRAAGFVLAALGFAGTLAAQEATSQGDAAHPRVSAAPHPAGRARRIGRMRVYLNAEKLFDTRQSRFDPLLRPSRSRIGRWTTDAWAPLDGRSFNAGVRLEF